MKVYYGKERFVAIRWLGKMTHDLVEILRNTVYEIQPTEHCGNILYFRGGGATLECHLGEWIVRKGKTLTVYSDEKFNSMYVCLGGEGE